MESSKFTNKMIFDRKHKSSIYHNSAGHNCIHVYIYAVHLSKNTLGTYSHINGNG